jgi:hypothetical protein
MDQQQQDAIDRQNGARKTWMRKAGLLVEMASSLSDDDFDRKDRELDALAAVARWPVLEAPAFGFLVEVAPSVQEVRKYFQLQKRLEQLRTARFGANKTKTEQIAKPPHPAQVKRSDPELAKRRVLSRNNRTASAENLCAMFDFQDVPLPDGWAEEYSIEKPEKAGLPGMWAQAWAKKPLRPRIRSIISKDRA